MTSTVLDVLVVGGGPAGIAAAASAAETGASVQLIDEGVGPGGQIWRPALGHKRPPLAARWIERLARSRAVVRSLTAVVDVVPDGNGWSVLIEGERGPEAVLARSLILASGARERFLPFPGWTLPNVFGVGGAQALLKSGKSFRDARIVIAGSGPLLLPVAASLARARAKLQLVAEQAPLRGVARFATSLWKSPTKIFEAARYRGAFMGVKYELGAWPVEALGDSRVRAVVISNGSKTRTIDCDVLCAAFGLVPNVELARLAGCDIGRDGVIVDDRLATSVPGVFCAGEPTGIAGVDAALLDGEIAGRTAAGATLAPGLKRRRRAARLNGEALERAFALRPELSHLARPETIVCRCEDVRLSAIDPAWTARQAKLYTRAGMGPCQGRICGAALRTMYGWREDTTRPPMQPARVATLLCAASSREPATRPPAS